ncbi:MAG: thioredoxin domain-containing protein [Candidatus Nanohaloarchaea archaeon]|nr:thioredoxin domain-containing protein [Candidatus Nanohaloarchaea archaeon]
MTNQIELAFTTRQAILVTFMLGFVIGGAGMAGFQQLGTPTGALTADGDGGSGGAPTVAGPQPSPTAGSGAGGVSVSKFDIAGEPVMGKSDAPVTIAYWGDFQCPFCKRFEQRTFPQLVKNYIKQGKARFVFKDFAFLGPDSTTGGIASECVWNQVGNSKPSAYWNWHAKMFDKQDGENKGWGSQSDIVSMTQSVKGVNADQLETCMNNKRSQFKQEIANDKRQGQSVGISGTPGFVIYRTGSDTGTKLVGAQPYSRFKSVINSALNGGTGGSGTQSVDRTITVSGTEYSFSPSTITVKKGQTIRIRFTNTGRIPHNLRIPSLGVGSQTIRAGRTDSFTFTAPESGTFPIRFECTLPGHSESGMKGTLTTQ